MLCTTDPRLGSKTQSHAVFLVGIYARWPPTDRKSKRPFPPPLPPPASDPPPPAAAARAPRWRCLQHAPAACTSGAQPGVAWQCAAWTGGAGWGTVERQGVTGSEGLGAARREKLRAGLHRLDRSGGCLWRWDVASPTTCSPCGYNHPSPDALCVLRRQLEDL